MPKTEGGWDTSCPVVWSVVSGCINPSLPSTLPLPLLIAFSNSAEEPKIPPHFTWITEDTFPLDTKQFSEKNPSKYCCIHIPATIADQMQVALLKTVIAWMFRGFPQAKYFAHTSTSCLDQSVIFPEWFMVAWHGYHANIEGRQTRIHCTVTKAPIESTLFKRPPFSSLFKSGEGIQKGWWDFSQEGIPDTLTPFLALYGAFSPVNWPATCP